MFEQCAQLRRLGHEVSIGFNKPGDLLPRYREERVRVIPMSPYAPRRGHVILDVLGLLGNLARALPLRLDLVAANSYHSTFFAALLARMKRIPLVCHLRLNPPTSVSWPTRIGLREVSLFVAESTSVRNLWVERGIDPSAITIVHDGVDVERFRPLPHSLQIRKELGLEETDFVIFSGGRIDPVKDLESLLHCFSIVKRSEPRARLVIAGTPSSFADVAEGQAYVAKLKALAMSLGIDSKLQWLGHRSDMPELYSASDVVALFGQVPEPFGRVTCEALSCGRPMVTLRQGGSVEILTGEFSRLLFEPGDPSDAARVILGLVDWKSRDPEFARRARAHIQACFDLASMGARMERALADAAKFGALRKGPPYDCFKPRAAHAVSAAQSLTIGT